MIKYIWNYDCVYCFGKHNLQKLKYLPWLYNIISILYLSRNEPQLDLDFNLDKLDVLIHTFLIFMVTKYRLFELNKLNKWAFLN